MNKIRASIVILKRSGFSEHNAQKPYLLRKKIGRGYAYADFGGTYIVPIYRDPRPLMYFFDLKSDAEEGAYLKELTLLERAGLDYRFSFFETDELGGYALGLPLSDGYCVRCKKDIVASIDWAEMARINKLKMNEWDPSALEAQLARQMRLCQGCRAVLVVGKEKVCPLYENCEVCQCGQPPCSHAFDEGLDIEKIEAKQRIEAEKRIESYQQERASRAAAEKSKSEAAAAEMAEIEAAAARAQGLAREAAFDELIQHVDDIGNIFNTYHDWAEKTLCKVKNINVILPVDGRQAIGQLSLRLWNKEMGDTTGASRKLNRIYLDNSLDEKVGYLDLNTNDVHFEVNENIVRVEKAFLEIWNFLSRARQELEERERKDRERREEDQRREAESARIYKAIESNVREIGIEKNKSAIINEYVHRFGIEDVTRLNMVINDLQRKGKSVEDKD
jgi:hypothetical protein